MGSHCVPCKVIHSYVLSSQLVYLQVDHAVRIISGEGESVFHQSSIIGCIITTYNVYGSNPFQTLSWSLIDTVDGRAIEGETRDCIGELQ